MREHPRRGSRPCRSATAASQQHRREDTSSRQRTCSAARQPCPLECAASNCRPAPRHPGLNAIMQVGSPGRVSPKCRDGWRPRESILGLRHIVPSRHNSITTTLANRSPHLQHIRHRSRHHNRARSSICNVIEAAWLVVHMSFPKRPVCRSSPHTAQSTACCRATAPASPSTTAATQYKSGSCSAPPADR